MSHVLLIFLISNLEAHWNEQKKLQKNNVKNVKYQAEVPQTT